MDKLHDSGLIDGQEAIVPVVVPARSEASIWLNGDVLMCACPDCRAPMTVRLWLMLADCWQCGSSIELTEEQEREAKRLLDEADDERRAPEAERRPAPAQPTSRPATPAAAPAARPSPAAEQAAAPPASRPPRRARQPSSIEDRVNSRLGRVSRRRGVSVWMHELFHSTPAWLVSLVLHLILLTLLALWSWDGQADDHLITLSSTINPMRAEGGDIVSVKPQNELAFDLPLPKNIDLADNQVREVIVRADQDARELRLEPGVAEPNLPPLSIVKGAIGGGGGNGVGRSVAARDPRIRVEVVNQEGGTTMTEAAVARGLRWLAQHQDEDGHWSLQGFDRRGGCTCGGGGGIRSDSAGTSLALLPFLGAGQTHLVGRYQAHVAKGLRWMLLHQKKDGDLRENSDGNSGMYAHGQATIVLCEAYLMTGDESLRGPAQRAVDFIVKAQHSAGGWRYAPGQAGDTSVQGWQLMALQSARAANLSVPDETMELSGLFLDSVSSRNGSLYAYLPGHPPTPVMTAEALLCRVYLGWDADTPALREGVEYLARNHLPVERNPNIYFWYYATQVMHHFGGEPWEAWNSHMREILVDTQEKRGHAAGSWSPRGDHAGAGGRVFMTSLAVCSLEVYYRHLPIFRRLKLNETKQ